MAHTNSTENYGLPQWIGTDKPTFLGDFNSAFGTIDTQMKANADASASAVATANSADAVATSANTNASTALNTANQALTDAQSAVSTAGTANSTANTANTNANAALRASAANTIENLAPAYDPTLTYAVGDLCTFVNAQNSGRLYKCIVPVNTPMEFNINYWDDVTTSEVYSRKSTLLSTATCDGVKTYKDIYNELMTNVTVDLESEYLLLILETANTTGIYHCSYLSNQCNLIAFTYVFVNTGINAIEMHLTNDSTANRITTSIASDGTVTTVDSSNNPVDNGVVYKLFKINTI